METMIVQEAFREYEEGTTNRVERSKGDEITVSAERADQLRERGLARKKPKARTPSEDRASDGSEQNPGMAE